MAKKVVFDIQAKVSTATKQVKALGTAADKTSKDIKNVGKETSKTTQLLTKAGAAMAGFLSVGAISQLVGKVIQVRSEFEKFEAVLANTLGSAKAAQIELAKIQKFASETPFSVRELTNAFVKLTNQGLKPTIKELKLYGDLAASVGKEFDQLAEAVIDATVGEFERLKEFGVKAKQSGDTVAFTFKGVTTEVRKTSEAIRDYVTGLGNLEGVSGAMEAISKTLGGRISNLGDSFDDLFNTLGEANSGTLTNTIGLINELTQAMTSAVAIADVMPVRGAGLLEFFKSLTGESTLLQLRDATAAINQFTQTEIDHIQFMIDAGVFGIDEAKQKSIASLAQGLAELESLRGTLDKAGEAALLTRIGSFKDALTSIHQFEFTKTIDHGEKLSEAELKRLEKLEKERQKIFIAGIKFQAEALKFMRDFEDKVDEEADDTLEKEVAKFGILTDMRTTFTNNEIIEFKRLKDAGEILTNEQLTAVLAAEEQAANAKLDIAASLTSGLSELLISQSDAFKALAITTALIDTYASAIKAYKAALNIPLIGLAAAPVAAAAAVAFGLANVARIASFAEGGFTGLGTYGKDKDGRISGYVHENEFVFNQDKTRRLRPLFENIHNDRINIEGLAKLTRGDINNVTNNEFNARILEREVGRIYDKMGVASKHYIYNDEKYTYTVRGSTTTKVRK